MEDLAAKRALLKISYEMLEHDFARAESSGNESLMRYALEMHDRIKKIEQELADNLPTDMIRGNERYHICKSTEK